MTATGIALSTGVTLDTILAGPEGAPAVLFLHGFPESNRTWRHQITDLARDHRVVAPSQRGFARSSKPGGVGAYATGALAADIVALADALGIGRFTLCGHDWGGAIAWAAALRHPDRVARLVIANAPHPLLFQRALIEDPAQRAASGYIRWFRVRGIEWAARAAGLGRMHDRIFAREMRRGLISAGERAATLAEWRRPGALTAMLNWYRAAPVVVPRAGIAAARPAWIDAPFPTVRPPTLVLWGMADRALLPGQLDGLEAHVADLRIERIDAGHFVPWEAPAAVTAAIRRFLAERAAPE